jgi:hypothetical protein
MSNRDCGCGAQPIVQASYIKCRRRRGTRRLYSARRITSEASAEERFYALIICMRTFCALATKLIAQHTLRSRCANVRMHALAQQVKNAQMRFPCRAAASAIEYRRRTHTLVHKHTPLFFSRGRALFFVLRCRTPTHWLSCAHTHERASSLQVDIESAFRFSQHTCAIFSVILIVFS